MLEIAAGSRSIDLEDEAEAEILTVADLVDAERWPSGTRTTTQLTAASGRPPTARWAFGHVIVDEAQELSPMAWRLLMRRCPSRSMTVVGDVAQTGALAGTASWQELLAPYVADRWRLAELTVNYRTPAEIMAVAAEVLAAHRPGAASRPGRCGTAASSRGTSRVARTRLGRSRRLREADAVGDGRLARDRARPAGWTSWRPALGRRGCPTSATGTIPDLEYRWWC